VVYVHAGDGYLYALNAKTGASLWSTSIGDSSSRWGLFSSPIVVNGVVYVGSEDGNVYAFGLKRGQEKSEAKSKRLGLKMLHADFNLIVSRPVATLSGAEF
jgi:outer membrane protein assembly factor BamB